MIFVSVSLVPYEGYDVNYYALNTPKNTAKMHRLCRLFWLMSLGMFVIFVILLDSNRYPPKKMSSPSPIACWTWISKLDPSPQISDLDLEKSKMSLDLPQSNPGCDVSCDWSSNLETST
jgi:hypothetical protein